MNGVPLRRVNQAYVISTSTKIDLSNFKLPERLSDDFFKREPKKKKRTEDMFEDAQEVDLPAFIHLELFWNSCYIRLTMWVPTAV